MWDQTSPRDPGEPRQLRMSAYCSVKLKSQAGKRKTARRVQARGREAVVPSLALLVGHPGGRVLDLLIRS